MYTFAFEKLTVWQNTRKLVKNIYEITRKYPEGEKFGLVSQIRRAIVSVSSNIAEGSSRITSKDQAHFYNTSYSSLMEVLSQVILSSDLEFITIKQYEDLREEIEEISIQLNALRNAALKKVNK
jgi:four helix bundle protein